MYGTHTNIAHAKRETAGFCIGLDGRRGKAARSIEGRALCGAERIGRQRNIAALRTMAPFDLIDGKAFARLKGQNRKDEKSAD
ncbi:MAG: hypothetical protein K9J80_10735 [Sulfuritalea sp.]|nr:hypothetical protein [Sulfuritalea sp.]